MIHAARGRVVRSRRTITVGSFRVPVMLTGATELAVRCVAAATAGSGNDSLDRRTKAAGGDDSRAPEAGERTPAAPYPSNGTVLVRTNGGALTEGSRETDDGGAIGVTGALDIGAAMALRELGRVLAVRATTARTCDDE